MIRERPNQKEFRDASNRASEGGKTTGCVRVPIDKTFALTCYKYQGNVDISLQSTYVDTRLYNKYVTCTFEDGSATENTNQGEGQSESK